MEKWLLVILSGATMFYVLFVFRGYSIESGLSASGHSLLIRSLAFGLLTSAVFYFMEFHLQRTFPVRTLKGRLAFYVIEVFLIIHLIFFLFNYFWSWEEFNWRSYLLFYYEVPAILLLPVILSKLVPLAAANRQADALEMIRFCSENEKEYVDIRCEDFLYLQSSGNYVEVFYQLEEKVGRTLLRNSLKAMETRCQPYSFVRRCHRSYLVNSRKIRSISHQKGKSVIDLGTANIPISEKYVKSFS